MDDEDPDAARCNRGFTERNASAAGSIQRQRGGVASGWSRDRPAEILSSVCHAVVVRDDSGQLGTELLSGCEVNSVERPEAGGEHSSGSVENPIVDPDEVEPSEDTIPALDG